MYVTRGGVAFPYSREQASPHIHEFHRSKTLRIVGAFQQSAFETQAHFRSDECTSPCRASDFRESLGPFRGRRQNEHRGVPVTIRWTDPLGVPQASAAVADHLDTSGVIGIENVRDLKVAEGAALVLNRVAQLLIRELQPVRGSNGASPVGDIVSSKCQLLQREGWRT